MQKWSTCIVCCLSGLSCSPGCMVIFLILMADALLFLKLECGFSVCLRGISSLSAVTSDQ
jgi:hypothetical protein